VKLPQPLADTALMAMDLRSRIVSHSQNVKRLDEMEAAIVGVFDQVAQAKREKFEALVQNVVRPAFEEFKAALRLVGRDAVIVSNMTHNPAQSIRLVLVDRYLKFGIGKTLNLVNPKDDVTQQTNARFYEVYRIGDDIFVKERAVSNSDPISTQVTCEAIVPEFFENELGRLFERAYPATN